MTILSSEKGNSRQQHRLVNFQSALAQTWVLLAPPLDVTLGDVVIRDVGGCAGATWHSALWTSFAFSFK